MSIILNTDSYKVSHYLQYPPGTEIVTSYIESRGIASSFLPDYIRPNAKIVNFGLYNFIHGNLLKQVHECDVEQANEIFSSHISPNLFNKDGWLKLIEKHDGYLPLVIKALPEGTVHKPGIPQVVVRNTDPEFPWLTSYVETAMLRAVWYPSTVATLSRELKKVIMKGFLKTDEISLLDQVDFKLHDFGVRGVSSEESAAIGGASHLISFNGTDNVSAIMKIKGLYGFSGMPGFSIPASEHSTITSWGKEHEVDAYENMIKQFSKDGSLFACVSDSYNIYDACEKLWGDVLRTKLVNSKGVLIVRPDSGEPRKVVLKVLNILGDKFGFTLNTKGFKVLNNVRVIQGDGVNFDSISNIINDMIKDGWSIQNIAFGMGGALLQKVDRDSLKYAMKCNSITVDGEDRDVYKDPIDDKGKTSKKGLFDVIKEDGEFVVKPSKNFQFDELKVAYRLTDKKPYVPSTTWEKIRENAKITLDELKD